MAEPRHTAECAMRSADAEAAREAFQKRWPAGCRTCAARGGALITDLVSGQDTFEECHDCLALGLCPRCSKALMPGPGIECMHCSWLGPDNGEPLYPACICGTAEVLHA